MIETQLRLGHRPSAIAAQMGRARSTVTREMHRNGWRRDPVKGRGGQRIAGGYRAKPADRRAQVLAKKPRVVRRLGPETPLWATVAGYLREGLSPVQIASTLARMPEPVQLSAETIYTALYLMPRGHLRSSLLSFTRRGHQARRRQGRKTGPRKPPIPDMILIDQRPVEVQMRLVPGHWEGDMIVGQANRSQVGVLVERTTLFVSLVRLTSPRADVAAEAFTSIFLRFDSQMRRSMTYDQGSEMRHHKTLTRNTGVDVYFAHPHAPWERGICENINGLLRQYLPKGTDLSGYTQDQLDDIAWTLNTRIRKSLGWKAPAELFLPEGAFDFVKYWNR